MTNIDQKNSTIRELNLTEMTLVSGGKDGPGRTFFKDVAYAAGYSLRHGASAAQFAIGYAIASSNN